MSRRALPVEAVVLWDGRTAFARGHRDGLPVFIYSGAPAGLMTRRQLRAAGLSPGGQEPVAVLRFAHRKPARRVEFAALYRRDLAAPSRPATPAQRVALDRAMTVRRTCLDCGEVKPYCVPTSTRQCWDCFGDEIDRDDTDTDGRDTAAVPAPRTNPGQPSSPAPTAVSAVSAVSRPVASAPSSPTARVVGGPPVALAVGGPPVAPLPRPPVDNADTAGLSSTPSTPKEQQMSRDEPTTRSGTGEERHDDGESWPDAVELAQFPAELEAADEERLRSVAEGSAVDQARLAERLRDQGMPAHAAGAVAADYFLGVVAARAPQATPTLTAHDADRVAMLWAWTQPGETLGDAAARAAVEADSAAASRAALDPGADPDTWSAVDLDARLWETRAEFAVLLARTGAGDPAHVDLADNGPADVVATADLVAAVDTTHPADRGDARDTATPAGGLGDGVPAVAVDGAAADPVVDPWGMSPQGWEDHPSYPGPADEDAVDADDGAVEPRRAWEDVDDYWQRVMADPERRVAYAAALDRSGQAYVEPPSADLDDPWLDERPKAAEAVADAHTACTQAGRTAQRLAEAEQHAADAATRPVAVDDDHGDQLDPVHTDSTQAR